MSSTVSRKSSRHKQRREIAAQQQGAEDKCMRSAKKVKFAVTGSATQEECRRGAAIHFEIEESEVSHEAMLCWIRHNLTDYDAAFDRWRHSGGGASTTPYESYKEAMEVFRQRGRQFSLELYEKLPEK